MVEVHLDMCFSFHVPQEVFSLTLIMTIAQKYAFEGNYSVGLEVIALINLPKAPGAKEFQSLIPLEGDGPTLLVVETFLLFLG